MDSKKWQTPKVIFQPEVYLGMQRGINQIVNAIRPTLGPFPRLVAIESTIRRDKTPELLDSGGLIARRVIQLRDRDEDVAAMYIRHMLWQLHEMLGDSGDLFGAQSVNEYQENTRAHRGLTYDASSIDVRWQPSTLPIGQKFGPVAPLFKNLDEKIVEEERSRLGK